MEKNKFKGLIWLFVLLIILVIFVIALVIYKGFFVDNQINNITTTSTNSSTTTKKKETFSKEQLQNYLNYVPSSMVYAKDAYNGSKVTIDSIEKSILAEHVFNSCKPIVNTNELWIEDEVCSIHGRQTKCQPDEYVEKVKFNKISKEMYNVDNLEVESFRDSSGTVYLIDEYYIQFGWKTGSGLTKVNFLIDYEKMNGNLIIYENAAFINEINNTEYKFYKTHNDRDNYYKICNLNSNSEFVDGEWENCLELLKEDIKVNEDYLTYKHTFKKHVDGTGYYWYSTEVVED